MTLQPYQGIVLETASSLRLHGGLAALLSKIKTGYRQLGYRVIHGIAPTVRAAWWFALAKTHGANIADIVDTKYLREQLAKLPVTDIDLSVPTMALFEMLGIRTLADCLAFAAH